MTVIESHGGEWFTIYLPRTKEDEMNNTHPQVQVRAEGLTAYTLAALKREAEKTHKRIDREQRKAAAECEG